jgi:hypothetical protein
MRDRIYRLVAFAILVGLLASCATPEPGAQGTAGLSATPDVAEPVGSLSASVDATGSPTISMPDLSGCVKIKPGVFPHDAPDLEALLPTTIAGREMLPWSVTGWCLLHLGWEATDAQWAAEVEMIDELAIDVEDLRMAVIGRSTDEDPPYFVWAVSVPTDETTTNIAMQLLMQAIGVVDQAAYIDEANFHLVTIAGKSVLVGSGELLVQDSHQRGKPFEHGTDENLFVIVTDDDAWAEDALRQLP